MCERPSFLHHGPLHRPRSQARGSRGGMYLLCGRSAVQQDTSPLNGRFSIPLPRFRCPLCYMYFKGGSPVVCSRLVVQVVQELVQHPARAFQIIIANVPACDIAGFLPPSPVDSRPDFSRTPSPQAPSVIVGPNKTNRNNPKHDSNHQKK